MHKHILRGLATAALLATTAAPALAQIPFSPRAMGMAGAYLGLARGEETLFLNPANLGLRDNPQWSVGLLQFSAGGTLLGADFSDLKQLISDHDDVAWQNSLLASIPETGTEASYQISAPLFALQVGPFAVGLGYGAIGQHTASKDIVDLLVRGYEPGRTDYGVGNTSGSRLTYWDVAAGYGRQFGRLSLGVTGHYIRPGSAEHGRMFEPSVDVENEDISVNYVSVIARGGSGYAVDFGAALQTAPGVVVSAAIANAASHVTWSNDLVVRDMTLDRADIDDMKVLDLKQRLEAAEKPLDPTAVTPRVLQTAQGLYDGGYFPAVAKLGVNWHPNAGTNLGVGYQKQLSDGDLAGPWKQTTSFGIQQKIPVVTLRAGYATSMAGQDVISGGLSLGPLDLGLARLHEGYAEGAQRAGWVLSFGLSAHTPITWNGDRLSGR